MISIVIPIYDFPNSEFFLKRCLDSIKKQTFTDYEVIITKDGKMAENTNSGIKKSKGQLIKILFEDDYFYDKHSLQRIANFKGDWLVTGCIHDCGELFNPHYPYYSHEIGKGVNTIGSPSVLTFKNEDPLLFDENLEWLLDCDYYERMFTRYGPPTILNDINVVIGIGQHQATNKISDEIKLKETYDSSVKAGLH